MFRSAIIEIGKYEYQAKVLTKNYSNSLKEIIDIRKANMNGKFTKLETKEN